MSIFSKLKKISSPATKQSEDNITITVEEPPTLDNRLANLESQIKGLNEKFDRFLQILQQKQ
jgi:chaperonin cofactor prefoldin